MTISPTSVFGSGNAWSVPPEVILSGGSDTFLLPSDFLLGDGRVFYGTFPETNTVTNPTLNGLIITEGRGFTAGSIMNIGRIVAGGTFKIVKWINEYQIISTQSVSWRDTLQSFGTVETDIEWEFNDGSPEWVGDEYVALRDKTINIDACGFDGTHGDGITAYLRLYHFVNGVWTQIDLNANYWTQESLRVHYRGFKIKSGEKLKVTFSNNEPTVDQRTFGPWVIVGFYEPCEFVITEII